jgi:hypothetical protein
MKKQYKYLLMTLLSLIFLGACSSGEDDIPEPAPKPDPDKVTISTTNLTTEANGGTSKLTFTTNKAWTASSNQAWCKLDKTSGTSGAITINLTLEANTTDQERTAEITIKAGTSTATATIKQAKKEPAEDPDKITLGESSFSVEAEGKVLTITLTANKAWTATSDQTWCTLSQTSGEAGTISLTATVSANTTDQERTAKISFKAGTATATATVKQAKKEAEGGDQGGEEGGGESGSDNGNTIEDMKNKKW